jgi:hypothetical protein
MATEAAMLNATGALYSKPSWFGGLQWFKGSLQVRRLPLNGKYQNSSQLSAAGAEDAAPLLLPMKA